MSGVRALECPLPTSDTEICKAKSTSQNFFQNIPIFCTASNMSDFLSFFLPSTLQTYSICSTQKEHYDRMKSCRISRSTSSEMTSLIAHFSRIFAHLRGLMDHSTLGRPCLTNGKSNTQETAQNLHRFSQALVSFPEPSCFMFRHKFKTM